LIHCVNVTLFEVATVRRTHRITSTQSVSCVCQTHARACVTVRHSVYTDLINTCRPTQS